MSHSNKCVETWPRRYRQMVWDFDLNKNEIIMYVSWKPRQHIHYSPLKILQFMWIGRSPSLSTNTTFLNNIQTSLSLPLNHSSPPPSLSTPFALHQETCHYTLFIPTTYLRKPMPLPLHFFHPFIYYQFVKNATRPIYIYMWVCVLYLYSIWNGRFEGREKREWQVNWYVL